MRTAWDRFAGFDFTPFGLTVCAVLLTFGLGQFRLFDMVPIVYDQVVRQLPDPVLVVDLEGRVLTSNPAAAALLGQEISTPGRRLVNQARLAESTRTVDLASAAAARARKSKSNRTARGRRFRVSVTPLRVRAFFELGRIFVFRETTQDRLAQLTLEESRQAAIEANRAKSEFLAVMSHELRTPLNAVIGSSSLLMDTPLDMAQREYAGMIRSSSQSLLRVINDILDLSKIEAGRMTLEHIDFDLRSAIEDCIEMVLPAALRKGLEVVLDFSPECGGMFQGDPARIRQILINFLSNAAKFTDHGSIRVEAGKAPPAEGPRCRRRHGCSVGGRGHGSGDRAGVAALHLRELPPGRRLDHAALRGHGPGAGDLPQAVGADGRRDRLLAASRGKGAASGAVSRCSLRLPGRRRRHAGCMAS